MCINRSTSSSPGDRIRHVQSAKNGNRLIDESGDNCDYIFLDDIRQHKVEASDFTVIQLNIRGIMNKQTALSELLYDCYGMSKVDAILLCETWHKTNTTSLIKIVL